MGVRLSRAQRAAHARGARARAGGAALSPRRSRKGMRLLEDAHCEAARAAASIPGETVFKLYDTYGFPEDLTADIARERNFGVDQAGFEAAMAAQRERARKASRFAAAARRPRLDGADEQFLGYETARRPRPAVVALLDARGEPSRRSATGETGHGRARGRTPFYAESGGQVGDTRAARDRRRALSRSSDTQKLGAAHGHHRRVLATAESSVGDTVACARRCRAASRDRAQSLGDPSAARGAARGARRARAAERLARRAGPPALRFRALPARDGRPSSTAIEALVNEQIRANAAPRSRVLPYEEAIARGALAFFGDKYGDTCARAQVRRLLDRALRRHACCAAPGDIGFFKIVARAVSRPACGASRP